MDFALSDDQQAAVELADRILTDRCGIERHRELAAAREPYDRSLWAEMAQADLVGLSLPEAYGGGGYGFLEACLVAEQVGRHVADIPWWATVVCGALPIAALGTDAQRERYLPPVIGGEALFSAALEEELADPRSPATVAEGDGDGVRITGTKVLVPVADQVEVLVVSARNPHGAPALYLVAPGAEGVRLVREDAMGDWPLWRVEMDGVRVSDTDRLGSPDAAGAVDWLVDRATAALCAVTAGVVEQALRITAGYATERVQFDRPIGSFQAVGQRLADAYIDVEAVRLTMLNAVSLLDADAPADKELATAKFWASEGAGRVVHAALHVHGGISIDLDYPIHRYFLWAKQAEFMLGSATPQLVRLGGLIAEG